MYVSEVTIIGSDNCLSPGRRQAIIWNNAENIITCTIRNKLQRTLNRNWYFSFKKIQLKMESGKWRPLCVDLNGLINKDQLTEMQGKYQLQILSFLSTVVKNYGRYLVTSLWLIRGRCLFGPCGDGNIGKSVISNYAVLLRWYWVNHGALI